jgi:hypothetical protein
MNRFLQLRTTWIYLGIFGLSIIYMFVIARENLFPLLGISGIVAAAIGFFCGVAAVAGRRSLKASAIISIKVFLGAMFGSQVGLAFGGFCAEIGLLGPWSLPDTGAVNVGGMVFVLMIWIAGLIIGGLWAAFAAFSYSARSR